MAAHFQTFGNVEPARQRAPRGPGPAPAFAASHAGSWWASDPSAGRFFFASVTTIRHQQRACGGQRPVNTTWLARDDSPSSAAYQIGAGVVRSDCPWRSHGQTGPGIGGQHIARAETPRLPPARRADETPAIFDQLGRNINRHHICPARGQFRTRCPPVPTARIQHARARANPLAIAARTINARIVSRPSRTVWRTRLTGASDVRRSHTPVSPCHRNMLATRVAAWRHKLALDGARSRINRTPSSSICRGRARAPGLSALLPLSQSMRKPARYSARQARTSLCRHPIFRTAFLFLSGASGGWRPHRAYGQCGLNPHFTGRNRSTSSVAFERLGNAARQPHL